MKQNHLFPEYTMIGPFINHYMESYKKLLGLHSTVLITGETGTGKELVSRWLHYQDPKRREQPFVKITLPNISENIFESEIFGYEKGAFTGAIASKKGLIEVAEKGTIFFDEIENATPSIQSKLLQLLEDRIYRKVGGTEYYSTDARFVITTNMDLQVEVQNGRFRSDLYYRLAVLEMHLPNLNHRQDDILYLANYFLQGISKQLGKTILPLQKNKLLFFSSYRWPGNIRELKNFIEKEVIFATSDTLDFETMPQDILQSTNPVFSDYKSYIHEKEIEFFIEIYKQKNGVVEDIAASISMSIPFVYKKLKELKIT